MQSQQVFHMQLVRGSLLPAAIELLRKVQAVSRRQRPKEKRCKGGRAVRQRTRSALGALRICPLLSAAPKPRPVRIDPTDPRERIKQKVTGAALAP
ncbi:hypothetical protein AAFF_G00416180 [Aldrovandia affinis]|uniref:Uncharacterized protein n=1 Tax=Aldrovandia affinis TaxID=143900 RepID=A0AAD7WJ54_9TELE|nr:hypothetical protein AAFF_G00416180 [Aldrovandia affinis]